MREHRTLCAIGQALLALLITLAAFCTQPQVRVLASRSRSGRRYELVLDLDFIPPHRSALAGAAGPRPRPPAQTRAAAHKHDVDAMTLLIEILIIWFKVAGAALTCWIVYAIVAGPVIRRINAREEDAYRQEAMKWVAERQHAEREAAIERAREEEAANDFARRCREIIDRVGA